MLGKFHKKKERSYPKNSIVSSMRSIVTPRRLSLRYSMYSHSMCLG